MKFISAFLTILIYFGYVSAQDPPVEGAWELTFEDDFDLNYIDPTKWHHGGATLFTNGMAANVGDNVWTENGFLNILAEKRPAVFAGKNYTYASTEISTFMTFRQTYGYIEARIKYDAVQGVWPAFWLMPDRGKLGPEEQMKESYLRFEIDTTIEKAFSAKLKIKTSAKSASGMANVSVHSLLESEWNEGDITWNNKPAYDPIYIRQLTSTNDLELVNEIITGQYIEIDVTKAVDKALEENKAPGFALLDKFMRNVEIDFFSKEATNVDDRPLLELNGEIYYPADDAYVLGGDYASSNFGDQNVLRVHDPWVSNSSTYDGGMEMDILESLGIWGPDQNQNALHWDGYDADHQSAGTGKYSVPPTEDGFHIYGVYWKPGILEFYVDGKQTWQYKSKRVATVSGHLILTHQIGGWDGNSDVKDELLPATMMVDYVRAYEDLHGASIHFTSPNENDIYPENSSIPLELEVKEYGGEISEVAFYNNKTLINIDSVKPFYYKLINVNRGEYVLSAEGFNPDGQSLSSDTLNILVADPPYISLESDVNGKVFQAPANLDIDFNATSNTGKIERVELIHKDTVYSIDPEAPFTFNLTNLTPGNYYFYGRAIDDKGLESNTNQVYFNVEGEALSLPWQQTNIGKVGLEGTAKTYNGEFILEAAGKDKWGNADQLLYVHQSLTGDGEIVAQIQSLQEVNQYSKAGLLMRDALEPGSKIAAVSIYASDNTTFTFRRTSESTYSEVSNNDMVSTPYWLKLKRQDNVFTAYKSEDATTWQAVFNPVSIDMQDPIFIGIYASANSDNELCTAIFNEVTISGNSYVDELPLIFMDKPAVDTTLFHSNNLLLSASSSDPDGGMIQQLSFFSDSIRLVTLDNEPFEYTWSDIPEGSYQIYASAIDDEGSIGISDTIEVTVTGANGIEANSSDNFTFEVLPVPSVGDIKLKFQTTLLYDNVRIRIYNILGHEINTFIIRRNETALNLSYLSDGIYFMSVDYKGNRCYRKFVIDHK